jgi:hypothetical protein
MARQSCVASYMNTTSAYKIKFSVLLAMVYLPFKEILDIIGINHEELKNCYIALSCEP